MGVNAVHDPYHRRPRAMAYADTLAGTVGLDMAKAGWTVTADTYLGRVTKARILEAVRDAKGDDPADRITGLKKPEMVTAAEELMAGSGWLPEVLRTSPLLQDDCQVWRDSRRPIDADQIRAIYVTVSDTCL